MLVYPWRASACLAGAPKPPVVVRAKPALAPTETHASASIATHAALHRYVGL
jgi:hypothetical protein